MVDGRETVTVHKSATKRKSQRVGDGDNPESDCTWDFKTVFIIIYILSGGGGTHL